MSGNCQRANIYSLNAYLLLLAVVIHRSRLSAETSNEQDEGTNIHPVAKALVSNNSTYSSYQTAVIAIQNLARAIKAQVDVSNKYCPANKRRDRRGVDILPGLSMKSMKSDNPTSENAVKPKFSKSMLAAALLKHKQNLDVQETQTMKPSAGSTDANVNCKELKMTIARRTIAMARMVRKLQMQMRFDKCLEIFELASICNQSGTFYNAWQLLAKDIVDGNAVIN